MSRKHYTAEEAAEKFLRNLDGEIEAEKFHSDGDSDVIYTKCCYPTWNWKVVIILKLKKSFPLPETGHRIAVKD